MVGHNSVRGNSSSSAVVRGITHVQSSPHYPQANGAAEAAVKSVKNLIIIVQIETMFLSILSERRSLSTETLRGSTVYSQPKIIYGRPMRSHVVTHYRTFKPEWQKQVKEADKKATLLREKAKAYYDQCAHPFESWTLAGSSVCSTLSPSAEARSPKLLAKINVGEATSSNLKGEECFGEIVDSCVYFLVHDLHRTCIEI